MIGEIWMLLIIGYVAGFFSCRLLWMWTNNKKKKE